MMFHKHLWNNYQHKWSRQLFVQSIDFYIFLDEFIGKSTEYWKIDYFCWNCAFNKDVSLVQVSIAIRLNVRIINQFNFPSTLLF